MVYKMHTSNAVSEEVTWDDIRAKLDEAKEKAKNTVRTTLSWMMEHPEYAVAVTTFAAFSIRKLDKYLNIYRENKLRNSMIYDRSLGMYWETKRPLTANQRLTIEARHNAGESYGAILSDMKVLKR